MSASPTSRIEAIQPTLTNLDRRRQRLREDINAELGKLTPDRQAFLLERLAANNNPAAELALVRDIDYRWEPVPVHEFIYQDRYLGKSLKGSVYPAIVDDLVELFEGNYIEVCLGGSWGWGKSREIEIGIAYELYLLSCMRDPAAVFGLIPGSKLVFLNVSVDVRQAQKVLFGGLRELLERSPYFSDTFPFDHKMKSELRFLRTNIVCRPVAASERAILGEDVFSAAIDEANFMQVVEKSKRSVPGESGLYDQAQAVADKLAARIRNRFNQRGKLPGRIWYASSARYPNDFSERKEAEAKTNATIFVRHRAQWETKPRSAYMKESFKVEVGDLTRRTRVLKGDERDVQGKVIDVPMDFYQPFINEPDKAVRDIAGLSVLSIEPFITRREMIRKMFDNGKLAGMQPTFTKNVVTLQGARGEGEYLLPQNLHHDMRQKKDQYGWPVFEDPQRTKPVMGRVLFPALHYAHFDLSKDADSMGDKSGFCCVHAVGSKQVPRWDEVSGKDVYELKPVIMVDLALRVGAPRGGEIDIAKMRSLILQLHNVGFEFGMISFDQFGSQESVKALKDKGFTADVYSVDTDFTPWDELKQALYDERLLCYEFHELEEELAQLERTPKKIDHPTRGSKDIADCLAAAVHHCEEGWRRAEGSRGMFQFGAVEYPGDTTKPIPLIDSTTINIAHGREMTEQEVDEMLFGPLKDRDVNDS